MEKKCRLFGKWDRVCFVYPRFSFLSSRIIQKKKQWLVAELGLSDPTELRNLSPRWWFHFAQLLREVVMPAEFYMVGPADCRVFDGAGLRAFVEDWPVSGEEFPESRIKRSQFNLFFEIGAFLFGHKDGGVSQYAIQIMAESDANSSPALPKASARAQKSLELNPSIESEWNYAQT